MNRIVYRNNLGQFSTHEKATMKQEVTEEGIFKEVEYFEEEEPEEYLHHNYVVSFNYDTKGRHGRHPFHAEFKITSSEKLSNNEILERIIDSGTEDDKIMDILSACKMKVGYEPESEKEKPEDKVSSLGYDRNVD